LYENALSKGALLIEVDEVISHKYTAVVTIRFRLSSHPKKKF